MTINNLCLCAPFLIPSTETQLIFNESIQNSYRIVLDDWYPERRIVTETIYQVHIGSAQSVRIPKYLIASHQTAERLDAPDKRNILSRFDNLNVRKYFVEIDGQRYLRDGVLTKNVSNDYIDQNRDLNF